MATNNSVNTSLSGQSGTGSFAGTISPTITTPTIAQINDTNNNIMMLFTPTASAVNYIQIVNDVTGGVPIVRAKGTDTDVALNLLSQGADPVNLGTQGAVLGWYSGTGLQHLTRHNLPTSAGAQDITWPDASGTILITGQAINTVPSINFGGSTLSTYAQSTSWTPTITFATPGNLSVSYATQTGTYSRIGNIVVASFTLTFTPTYTTASGFLRITGLPFTVGVTSTGAVSYQATAYPASTTNIFLTPQVGQTFMLLGANGASTATNFFSVTQIPTATANVTIQGTVVYLV